jgi:hypothetical protein
MKSNLDDIKSVIKSKVTSCIIVVTIGSKSNHIRSPIITLAISDNKVANIRAKSNLSINNCTVVNKNIKITTSSVFNKESNDA